MPPPTRARVSLPARYRVTSYLAGGGMASIWRAEDTVLGRAVAVKVMAAYLNEDPHGAERFEREARAAARVSSHPHVVTIYDVGEHDGRPFIVMELIDGGTVGDRLAAGRVERAAALSWLRDAAAGLDAAHAQGIVHRDVKPGNLLLDGGERVLVADFGIARLLSEATVTLSGQLLGTAAYLAPEQVLGEPATAAADRYSLGVVAYELLTGSRPFTAEHVAAQARQHVDDEPDPPSSRDPALPRAVDAVLARALAKSPADRWPTCADMVDALERALGAPSDRPRAARRPPSRALGLAAAAVAVAVAVALAAILLSGGGDDPAPRATRTTTRHRTPAKVSHESVAALAADQTRAFNLIHSGQLSQGLALERHVSRALESQGYSVERCREPRERPCLTYAFALFDTGHALRLLGDDAGAAAVLSRRLRIDNQRATVQAELVRAGGAAG